MKVQIVTFCAFSSTPNVDIFDFSRTNFCGQFHRKFRLTEISWLSLLKPAIDSDQPISERTWKNRDNLAYLVRTYVAVFGIHSKIGGRGILHRDVHQCGRSLVLLGASVLLHKETLIT